MVWQQQREGSVDPKVLVLGIGNLLWADEGFGVRAAEAMNAAYSFGPEVTLLDGGTQGLYLLPHLSGISCLIVFDAVDYGLTPGTMKIVRDDDVPSFMGAKKMSLHQTGFQDVLAAAVLTGCKPQHILLIGVQPERLEDFGGGLSPSVAAMIDPAIDVALDELKRFAITPTKAAGSEALNDTAVARDAYEAGRPAPEVAFRDGDVRFVNMKAAH